MFYRYHRQLMLLSMLLFILLSVSALGQKDEKKKEAPPAGTPILWREPTDIATRDLYLGPGGAAKKPDLSKVTLIRNEPGGYSTKYRVRDGSGRVWVAKIGKEAQSETAAVRLLWAVGYFTDIDYLVPSVRIEGLDKTFENVRFGAREKNVKRIDGWSWDSNPFVGKREFQGLKVMMVLLNNWDIKDSNNKILVIHDDRGSNELQYVVHDLGGTFGKVSKVPRVFQFKPDRNNPEEYAKTHLVEEVKGGNVNFVYSAKKSYLFKNITVDDARWIAGWLSRLSDQQIQDAFRAANYSPEEVRMLAGGVRQRINELTGLQSSQQAAK